MIKPWRWRRGHDRVNEDGRQKNRACRFRKKERERKRKRRSRKSKKTKDTKEGRQCDESE